jgi:hypothetical protein
MYDALAPFIAFVGLPALCGVLVILFAARGPR